MARDIGARFRFVGRVPPISVARAVRVASFRATVTAVSFEAFSLALAQMAYRDCDVLQTIAAARRYCRFASDSWERLETRDV